MFFDRFLCRTLQGWEFRRLFRVDGNVGMGPRGVPARAGDTTIGEYDGKAEERPVHGGD
jgi:hypothetical protein